MVRERILLVLIVLFVAANVHAADPNEGLCLWGLTADGADHLLAARLGFVQNKIEVGATVKYQTAQPDWGPEPDYAGAYLIFHANEFIQVSDPAPDNAWEQILHTLIGRPYGGIEGLLPTQGEQRTPKVNWIAGTLISTNTDFKKALVVEYQTGQSIRDDAESIFVIGARIRF